MMAIPCTDTVKSRTAFSLAHAAFAVKNFELDLLLRIGCDIIGSRVWLVREAMKRNATHILFVDHDMFFPPNAIEALVKHDKDIVGATYNFRQFPLQSTTLPAGMDDTKHPHPDVLPKELFKCKALGTGFLLIKLSVFDKIKEPWFLFGRNKEGELVQGEDTYFCIRAIEAGFDVWADPTLNVRHVGEHLY